MIARQPRHRRRLGHSDSDEQRERAQVWIQLKAVLLTIFWSGVVSSIAFTRVDMTIGPRVAEDEEREGLDITSHGETAYSK